jgi:ribonuclease P protein component
VIRNRVKRRVRDWFRRERQQVGGPLDVVVIVRRGAAELESSELHRQLSSLVSRAVRAV